MSDVVPERAVTQGRVTSLKQLGLGGTKITDAGLAHLRDLPDLAGLTLNNTGVTDESVEHLRRLTGLQELGLQDTKVSADGVARLKTALPRCTIVK